MSGQQIAKNPKYIEAENNDLSLLNRKIYNAVAGLNCINYYHKLLVHQMHKNIVHLKGKPKVLR